MPSLTIRAATPEDCGLILELITDLARYEKAEHEVLASADDIRRSLFGDEPAARALICEMEGIAVGFAVYFVSYSTWLGKPGLYLEDLYVRPEHRGSGAGKALLRELAAEAVSKGYGRFEWSVLDWNEPAIQFYRSIGAEPQDEWIRYRLDGEALQRFAQGN